MWENVERNTKKIVRWMRGQGERNLNFWSKCEQVKEKHIFFEIMWQKVGSTQSNVLKACSSISSSVV